MKPRHFQYLLFTCLFISSIYLAILHERYQPVGQQLLAPLELSKDSPWQQRGNKKQITMERDGARLDSTNPKGTVQLQYIVPNPQRFQLLRLSADIQTEGVIPGTKSWHKARLVLSSFDINNKWISHPHSVVALGGTNLWQHYEKTFTVHPEANQLRVCAQLVHAPGSMWVRKVELQEVDITPLYHYGQYVIICGWLLFLLWLTLPYAKQCRHKSWRLIALFILSIGISGVIAPAALKLMLLHLFPAHTDKIGHFILFTLIALFSTLICRKHGYVKILTDLVILAAATELIQLFVPGRSAMVSDWVIDTGGVLLGMLFAVAIDRLFKSRRSVGR